MASEQVQIVVSATDNASGALKTIQGNVDKFKSGFTQAMKDAVPASQAFGVALLGVTAGVVAFGASAVKAYNEAETAQKMLEHAVIGVTKGTQDQLSATMALADELEKKGVLDGDNIKVGLAQLSTFGLSNKAVQSLGGSLADLAVNQFGVNASGEQLSDTANMIAKALHGQFGVLEKSGIRFTDLQQKMITTGSEMEKVAAINEGFAQNLKFTNEVARQTGEGLQAHLGVQLGNIQEAIGQTITAQINPLLESFSKWIDSVGGVDGVMKILTNTLNTIKDNLPIIATTILAILTPAFVALGGSIIAATAPLLPFIAAGLAIGAAIQLIVNHFGGLQGTLDALQPVLQGISAFFNTVVKPALDLVWSALVQLWNAFLGFLPTLQMVWDLLASAFAPILGQLQSLFMALWEAIKQVWQSFMDLWNFLSPILMPVLEVLGAIIGVTIVAAIMALGLVIQTVIVVITALVNAITAVVKWVTDWVKSFDVLRINLVNWWNGVLALVKAQGDAIGATIKAMWDAVTGFFMDAMKAILSFVVSNFLSIKNAFSSFGEAAASVWSDTWNGISSIVTNAFDGIKNTVKGAINWIIDKLNYFIDQANNVTGIFANIGVNVPKINQIPRFSAGGIVPGALGEATLAVLHGGEKVIPAAGLSMAGAGAGGGITINITGNTISKDLDIRDLAERVGQAVMQTLNSNIRY